MKITRRQLRQIIQEELEGATREKESMLNELDMPSKEVFNNREKALKYRAEIMAKLKLERDPYKGRRSEEYQSVLSCVNDLINADVWPAECSVPMNWS